MDSNRRKTQFVTGALLLIFSLFAIYILPYLLARFLERIPRGRFDLGAVGIVFWVVVIPLALVSFILGVMRLMRAIFADRQKETITSRSLHPAVILISGLLIAVGSFVAATIFSDSSPVYIGLPLGAILFIVGLVGLIRRFTAKGKSQ